MKNLKLTHTQAGSYPSGRLVNRYSNIFSQTDESVEMWYILGTNTQAYAIHAVKHKMNV